LRVVVPAARAPAARSIGAHAGSARNRPELSQLELVSGYAKGGIHQDSNGLALYIVPAVARPLPPSEYVCGLVPNLIRERTLVGDPP
jgi:hypothetical protein